MGEREPSVVSGRLVVGDAVLPGHVHLEDGRISAIEADDSGPRGTPSSCRASSTSTSTAGAGTMPWAGTRPWTAWRVRWPGAGSPRSCPRP